MVEALLQATTHSLVRDGYDRLSTNRVAEQAGVSVGSLYQYFPSKEALVGALHVRWGEGVMSDMSALRAELVGVSLDQAIPILVDRVLVTTRRDPALSRAMLELLPQIMGRETLDQFHRRLAELMASWLERHADEIEVEDTALAAHVLVTALDGLCNQAVSFRPELLESRRFQDHIEDLAIGYLAPSRLPAFRAARRRRAGGGDGARAAAPAALEPRADDTAEAAPRRRKAAQPAAEVRGAARSRAPSPTRPRRRP
jgi:AcrR family transcriptional regulator